MLSFRRSCQRVKVIREVVLIANSMELTRNGDNNYRETSRPNIRGEIDNWDGTVFSTKFFLLYWYHILSTASMRWNCKEIFMFHTSFLIILIQISFTDSGRTTEKKLTRQTKYWQVISVFSFNILFQNRLLCLGCKHRVIGNISCS